MSGTQPQEKQAVADAFTGTWRYKVGLILIVVGHVVLLGGLALPFFGINAATIGAVVLGGEVTALSSIVFLGKEGFKAIKSRIVDAAKSTYTAPVGPARHYVGVVLMCTNVLTTYVVAAYAWAVFASISEENPIPRVFGLSLDQQDTFVQWTFLTGEISFVLAIYVLGAGWWGRFRSIFVWTEAEG